MGCEKMSTKAISVHERIHKVGRHAPKSSLLQVTKSAPQRNATLPDLSIGTRRVVRWLATLAALLSTLAAVQMPSAYAQSQSPAIIAVAVVQAPPGSEVPVQIGLSNVQALPRQAMLIFRGLPQGMHFSHGRLFGPGIWVTPRTASRSCPCIFRPVQVARSSSSFSSLRWKGRCSRRAK